MQKIKDLLKTFSYPALDTLVSFLGIFIFRIFTIRNTQFQDYGIYVILVTISTFSILLTSSITDKSFTHFFAKTKNRHYLASTIIFQITTLSIISIILIISKNLIVTIFKTSFNSSLISLIPLFIIGQIFINTTKNYFEAQQKFKQSFLISLINVIILNSIMIIFYYKFSFNTKNLYLINIITNSLLLFITIPILYKAINVKYIELPEIKSSIKELFSYGKYSLGLSLSFMFYTQADTLIIGILLPSKYITLYDAPKKLLPAIRMFSNTISKVVFPKISATKDKTLQKSIYYKNLKIGAIGGAILGIIILIFSKYLILLLFGDKFISSTIILQIFSIYFFIHPILNISGNSLAALKRPDKDFYTLLTSMITNIILDLILIPHFGVEGAAIATVLSIFLAGSMNFYKISKILN